MRTWILILALGLGGCGGSEPPPKAPAPKPSAITTDHKPKEIKSDPTGKHSCMMCNLKTNQDTCPGCGEQVKPVEVTSPKREAEGGRTSVAPSYGCPKTGCTFTSARKETCLTHGDTMLLERQFVCPKCAVSETVAGKCSTCGENLVSKFK